MRYNFKRLSGKDWYDTISTLRRRSVDFRRLNSQEELYKPENVCNTFTAYYYASTSCCKIIYYDYEDKWRKRLRQISFSEKEADPLQCVLTFRKIAGSYGELLPYEPHKYYHNGVYTYYKGKYEGKVTVLDMNSAYLWALSQPLADWETRTECTFNDVWNEIYDFYSFENELHTWMFYKKDLLKMMGARLWADVKIFGYKSSVHYEKTCKELYRLKCEVNKNKYKNVANIAVGCMHKRTGKQNNTTLAASLYAFFEWKISDFVDKFEKKGYNVIMITTDSIKIAGDYNEQDEIVKLGNGLGEFKIEYVGDGKYYSEGHYEESRVKWKGKPLYMINGHPRCEFINNLEEELPIYEEYAIY